MTYRHNPDKAASSVRDLIARAGIRQPPATGSGTLASEPVLVFLGPRRSTLHIFDHDGNEVGEAVKSQTGYELRDSEVRYVVSETHRPQGLEYEFVVSDPGGRIIGTINRNKVRMRDAFAGNDRLPNVDHRIFCEGFTVATIKERPRSEVLTNRAVASDVIARAHYLLDYLCCSRFTIADESSHSIARITYLQPYFVRPDDMSCVLESHPDITDPLRAMLVAMFKVVDRIRPRHHGN